MSESPSSAPGYVGLTTGACLAHLGHSRRLRRRRRREGRPCCSGARSRSSRPASTSWSREGLDGGRLAFVLGAAARPCRRRVRVPVRADAAGRGRLGRPQLHRGGGREIGPAARRRGDRHQQVDGAGRLDPGRRAGPRPRRRVRGVEPRVPPRGLGRARLPAPRPHRHRQRRPGRRHPGRRAASRACRPRSSSPTRPRPRRSSTPPTPSSPPRFASSTPSPTCARRSAPT